LKKRRLVIKGRRLTRKLKERLTQAFDSAIETNAHLKDQFLQFLPFLIASFITGLTAFLFSWVFGMSEKLSFRIYEANRAFVFISTPFFFLLSWWMVKKFAPTAKGSGIPQVMAAIELSTPSRRHLVSRFLSLRIIVIKVLASCAKVLGGGVSGREGPTIQISASIFNQIHRWLPPWWPHISQRNILIAGAASGLAAAFNTPLGGIIFAIEELSKFPIKYYKYPLFIAIIIAGLTAQGFAGPYLYLGYPKTTFSGFGVYGGIFVVAAVCGWAGAKSCKLMIGFMGFMEKQKTDLHQGALVVGFSLITATAIYYLGEEVMGSGKEYMTRLLFTQDKSTEWYMPLMRSLGLVNSFSLGGAGGVFAPSLSSGASIGAFIAELFNLNGNNANILILVGMAGFLTSVTRAPFTSTIIIFEMTDRHSIIFFLLMGTLVANLVAYRVGRTSFYGILKEKYLREARAETGI